MPPTKHALLSASSSHRWLNCTPSARLELEFEDQERQQRRAPPPMLCVSISSAER